MSDQEERGPLATSLDFDPYLLLELGPNASDAEIKQAYFRQVRLHPPERDPQTFKRIRAAYEVLKDPEARLTLDLLRVERWPQTPVTEKKTARAKTRKSSGTLTSSGTLSNSATLLPNQVNLEDVQRVMRAFSELSRRDFREDYKSVKPSA